MIYGSEFIVAAPVLAILFSVIIGGVVYGVFWNVVNVEDLI
jgi:hypothetical protein